MCAASRPDITRTKFRGGRSTVARLLLPEHREESACITLIGRGPWFEWPAGRLRAGGAVTQTAPQELSCRRFVVEVSDAHLDWPECCS